MKNSNGELVGVAYKRPGDSTARAAAFVLEDGKTYELRTAESAGQSPSTFSPVPHIERVSVPAVQEVFKCLAAESPR